MVVSTSLGRLGKQLPRKQLPTGSCGMSYFFSVLPLYKLTLIHTIEQMNIDNFSGNVYEFGFSCKQGSETATTESGVSYGNRSDSSLSTVSEHARGVLSFRWFLCAPNLALNCCGTDGGKYSTRSSTTCIHKCYVIHPEYRAAPCIHRSNTQEA